MKSTYKKKNKNSGFLLFFNCKDYMSNKVDLKSIYENIKNKREYRRKLDFKFLYSDVFILFYIQTIKKDININNQK